MKSNQITEDTPIVKITAGQLRDFLLKSISGSKEHESTAENANKPRLPKYIYGCTAAIWLFNISLTTLWKYKRTWLAPAIIASNNQRNTFGIDVQKAIQLMSAQNNTPSDVVTSLLTQNWECLQKALMDEKAKGNLYNYNRLKQRVRYSYD